MDSPPAIILSPLEVIQVTGFKIANKQCHALALMQIPYRVRPNGTPVVVRSAVEAEFKRTTKPPEAVLTLI